MGWSYWSVQAIAFKRSLCETHSGWDGLPLGTPNGKLLWARACAASIAIFKARTQGRGTQAFDSLAWR